MKPRRAISRSSTQPSADPTAIRATGLLRSLSLSAVVERYEPAPRNHVHAQPAGPSWMLDWPYAYALEVQRPNWREATVERNKKIQPAVEATNDQPLTISPESEDARDANTDLLLKRWSRVLSARRGAAKPGEKGQLARD